MASETSNNQCKSRRAETEQNVSLVGWVIAVSVVCLANKRVEILSARQSRSTKTRAR